MSDDEVRVIMPEWYYTICPTDGRLMRWMHRDHWGRYVDLPHGVKPSLIILDDWGEGDE